MGAVSHFFVLDVSAGSANILLNGEQAVVVDTGASHADGTLISDILDLNKVERIPSLVLTHNHSDHIGGARELLARFGDRIDEILTVCDKSFWTSKTATRLQNWLSNNDFDNKITEIVVPPTSPQPRTLGCMKALVFAPAYADKSTANSKSNDNYASMVLQIEADGNGVFLFPGDSQYETWTRIRKNNDRLKCTVLLAPHHAGSFGSNQSDLERFYREFVDADFIAVPTSSNTSSAHLITARKYTDRLVCTHYNSHCEPATAPSLDGHPLVYAPTHDNTPCMGTIVFSLIDGVWTLDRDGEHHAHTLSSTLYRCNPDCGSTVNVPGSPGRATQLRH